MPGPEFALAEAPCVRELVALGYRYLRPAEATARVRDLPAASSHRGDNELARDGLNQVLLRDEFLDAVRRINGVSAEVARAAYLELVAESDNEAWTRKLRGDYSRTGWHLKEQLRKELRQDVRLRAHRNGFGRLKEVAARIEEFALKHCVRVA